MKLKLILTAGLVTLAFASQSFGYMKYQRMSVMHDNAAAASGHLVYYGGPVISNVKIVAVFWGASVNPEVVSKIGGYYSAVTSSAYMDWLTEYNTTKQKIGRGTFGGNYTITPSTSATTIDDTVIQSELAAQIKAGKLPAADANTLYMIHFPAGDTETMSSGGQVYASCQDFCAYHSSVPASGQSIFYGVMPDFGGNCASGCGTNTAMLDNFTIAASHEMTEAITDCEVGQATTFGAPLAWYDNTPGNGEIGDICVGTQGNLTVGSTVYTVQGEWSNKNNACITNTK